MNDSAIELWSWRYTDEFGRRRVFPCKLSVEDAKARFAFVVQCRACGWSTEFVKLRGVAEKPRS